MSRFVTSSKLSKILLFSHGEVSSSSFLWFRIYSACGKRFAISTLIFLLITSSCVPRGRGSISWGVTFAGFLAGWKGESDGSAGGISPSSSSSSSKFLGEGERKLKLSPPSSSGWGGILLLFLKNPQYQVQQPVSSNKLPIIGFYHSNFDLSFKTISYGFWLKHFYEVNQIYF